MKGVGEIRKSFIAKCVYTHKVFVLVLGTSNTKKYKQCNKHIKKVVKIKTKQTIKKIDTKLHI